MATGSNSFWDDLDNRMFGTQKRAASPVVTPNVTPGLGVQPSGLGGGLPSLGSRSFLGGRPSGILPIDPEDPRLKQLELDETSANAIQRVLNDPIAMRGKTSEQLIKDLEKIAAGQKLDEQGFLGNLGSGVVKGLDTLAYVLNRPLATVTSLAKEISDIPSMQASPVDFFKQALAKDTTPSKYIQKTGVGWVDSIIGLTADVALDPLTYVTFGASAFAGRSGRLALSAKAATKEALEKAPSLAAKVADGSIARLGEWALTNAERVAVGLPERAGLTWTFGKGGMIGREGTTLAKLSEGAATGVGKTFAKGRAKLSDTGLFTPLQKITAPKSVKVANLTFYGRVADDPNVVDRVADLASYSASIRANAAGGLVQKKFGSSGQALAKEIFDYETNTGRRIFEVMENVRPAVDGVEQDLANRTRTFLNEMREYANTFTNEYANRRGVEATGIAHRENYVPHTLTPEAMNYVRSRGTAGTSSLSGIREMLGMNVSEFSKGPGILRGRTLQKGTKWLGKVLETDVGDGAASIREINNISQEVLKFKWFEEDGAQYLDNYLDSIVNQTKRVAFIDRLFDYGGEAVKKLTLTRTPNTRMAKQFAKIVDGYDNIISPILRQFADEAGDVQFILAPRIRLAQALVDLRPGGRILSDSQLDEVQQVLDATFSELKVGKSILKNSPQEIREAYEPLVERLELNLLAIANSVSTRDEADLIYNLGLKELYQRLIPDGEMPRDAIKAAEDVIDATEAYFGDVVRGAPASVRDETFAAAKEMADTAVEGRSAESLAELVQRLPATNQGRIAQSQIDTLGREVESIASEKDLRLADIAARRAEGEQIVEQQRQLFGTNVGIGGRSVSLPEARDNAARFMKSKRRKYNPPSPTTMTNPTFQSEVAQAYNKMPLGVPDPNTPAGRAAYKAYDALKKDIDEQYEYLTKELGIKVEFVEGDPYANPADMFLDIQNNRRLRIWSGESENPMLTHEQNLKLRAVHDYFGHASVGVRFDRNGEERAFLHHMQMFSPEARPALATEFRGQTAYLIEYGEFGPQKGYLLPKKFWGPDGKIDEAIEGLRTQGGATVDLTGKETRPTSGYQVSLGGDFERSIPASQINAESDIIDKLYAPFMSDKRVATQLGRAKQFFGTYYSSKTDTVYAEVSRNYDSIDDAYWQAVNTRQESILDWADLDAGNSGEFFTVDLINARERELAKSGRKLSNEELLAREELQRKATQQGSQTPTQATPVGTDVAPYPDTGAVRGGEGTVRGPEDGVRNRATDDAGRAGPERLAGLPKEPLTPQQVDEIIGGGTQRLKNIGYVYGEPARTAKGTRNLPLDKEAKNVSVSAQRKTAARQQKINELKPIADAAGTIAEQKEAWDAGAGAVYDADIAAIQKLVRESPPPGAAGEVTAIWAEKTRDTLQKLTSNEMRLEPAEADLLNRVVTQMKGLESRLAMFEADKAIAVDMYDKIASGKMAPKISSDIIKGWEAMESLGVQMPPEIRDRMFAKVAELGTPQGSATLKKMYDSYTRFFKVTAMLSPGFIVRNSYTAAFNNFIAGVSVADTRDALRFAKDIWTYGVDDALKRVPTNTRSLYEQALKVTYATGAGQTYDDILAPVLAKKGGSKFLNLKPVKAWSDANETAEVAFRFALGLSSIKKGLDFDDAVNQVSRYHFNYTDLSTLDEVARKFIPFWIFASRNIPLQITNQIARPSVYRMYEAIQRNFGASEEEMRGYPEWLRNRGPLRIPGLGPNNLLIPDLPQLDMAEQINMISDPIRLLSQANPLIKLPIELAGNRQLWNSVPFGEKPSPVRGPLDYPAYLAGMFTGSSGTSPATGERYTSSKAAYALPNLVPTLGQLQRLFPQLGGKEGYQSRQGSSIAGYVGLPYRRVSPEEKSNELTRRQFAIRDYLSSLTRTGQIMPKE